MSFIFKPNSLVLRATGYKKRDKCIIEQLATKKGINVLYSKAIEDKQTDSCKLLLVLGIVIEEKVEVQLMDAIPGRNG